MKASKRARERVMRCFTLALVLATGTLAATGCGSRTAEVPLPEPALETPAERARAVTLAVDDDESLLPAGLPEPTALDCFHHEDTKVTKVSLCVLCVFAV